MTTFRFKEARNSRESSANPPRFIYRYTAAGSGDPFFVRTYALSATPSIVATQYGTLWRQDALLKPMGYQLWRVEIPYGPSKREVGQYRVSFDTQGGSVHITNSRATRASYPASPTPPDNKQAIGIADGESPPAGTDIVIPALKIVVHFKHPLGVITMAQIKNLARYTGSINTDKFLTFEPGEVLFLGAAGSEGSDVETEVEYHFAMSENEENLQIGAITGIQKRGWDYAWIRYKDATDGGKGVKQPQFVYVERVYKERALSQALGFGA